MKGFLVGLTLTIGCIVQPFDAECEGATCLECSERSGCGWCRDVGCVAGDSRGDDALLCPPEDWAFGDCLPECEALSDCSSCASQRGCGWCLDRCLPGNEAGDRSGVCPASTWSYDVCDHPEDPCRRHTTCYSCGNGCGWCGERGGCFAGSAEGIGSAEFPASAACADWGPDEESCEHVRCKQNTTCDACIEGYGCEWCAGAGGFCFNPGVNLAEVDNLPEGSLAVYCGDAYAVGTYSDDQCPAFNDCERFNRQCGQCVETPGCIGCRYTGSSTEPSFTCVPDHQRACDRFDRERVTEEYECLSFEG